MRTRRIRASRSAWQGPRGCDEHAQLSRLDACSKSPSPSLISLACLDLLLETASQDMSRQLPHSNVCRFSISLMLICIFFFYFFFPFFSLTLFSSFVFPCIVCFPSIRWLYLARFPCFYVCYHCYRHRLSCFHGLPCCAFLQHTLTLILTCCFYWVRWLFITCIIDAFFIL